MFQPMYEGASTSSNPFLNDPSEYVLRYGLKHDKKALKKQSEAYLDVRRKIVRREDAARALLISANILSMSIMASQLTMYRWGVSESQTVAQATSILQEEVIAAKRKGYRVQRERPKPRQASKYADGTGLKQLYEKNMAKLERRKLRREARKEQQELQQQQQQQQQQQSKRPSGRPGARGGGGGGGAAQTTAAASSSHSAADALNPLIALSSDSEDSTDTESDFGDGYGNGYSEDGRGGEEGGGGGDSSCSSVCSAEKVSGMSGNHNENAISAAAPPDAVTRLVIVDCYTHENFTDIIEHVRYVDREYGLQLVVVLLLPAGDDAIEMQGAGSVIAPRYHNTIEAAYAAGYDLVLTHFFDHVVVNFLTDTFVSSAGRWRNDVRSKAAVGNYVSLKNVLLGRINTEALRTLVWNEAVDDTELLEVIGANTLALQGEVKRYTIAGQKLSRKAAVMKNINGAEVLKLDDEEDEDEESEESRILKALNPETLASYQDAGLPPGLPHLRPRDTARHGVRSARSLTSFMPLDDLAMDKDVISGMMRPSENVQHTVRRRRKNADPDDESEDAYEYILVDQGTEGQTMVLEAIEAELARQMAENDSKQQTIDALRDDLALAMRTTAAMKQKHKQGNGSGKDRDGSHNNSGSNHERPDSASLVNLTKEQQIYILKERLELANEHINTLLEGGAQGRSRGSTGGSAAGRRLGSISPHVAKSRGGLSVPEAFRVGSRTYNEGLEAGLMGLHDTDAKYSMISDKQGELAGSFHYGNSVLTPEELAARRKENECTNDVIASLQGELLRLQGRAGDDGAVDLGGLAMKLQEACERLQAQKSWIQQLEELRKMEELTMSRRVSRAVEKALKEERAAVAAAAVSTKRKRKALGAGKASTPRSTRKKKPLSEAKGSTDATAAANSVSQGVLGKLKAKHARELEGLRISLDAEYTEAREKAIENVQRTHRREMRAREKVLREKLSCLYLRIRKPYTKEYRSLLQQELNTALTGQRGVEQWLHHAITHLSPAPSFPSSASLGGGATSPVSLKSTGSNRTGLMGSVASISNSSLRQRVEQMSREYAAFALQVEKARTAIQEINDANHSAEGHAQLLQLVQQRKEAMEKVKYTHDVGELQEYLNALQELATVEDELAQWADVDVAAVFGTDFASVAVDPISAVALSAATNTVSDSGFALNAGGPASFLLGSFAPTAPQSLSGKPGAAAAAAQQQQQQTPERPPLHFNVPVGDSCGVLRELAAVFRTATTLGPPSAGDEQRTKRMSLARTGSGSPSPSPTGKKAGSPQRGDGGDSCDGDDDDEEQEGSAATLEAKALVLQAEFKTHRGISMTSDSGSAAQRAIYETLLSSYQNGFIHPDRMVDVERILAQGGECDSEAEWTSLYLEHHQELVRLLRLLVRYFPILAKVTKGSGRREVEAALERELRRNNGKHDDVDVEEEGEDGTGISFLVSADTAQLTSVVDYLADILAQWNHAGAAKKRASSDTVGYHEDDDNGIWDNDDEVLVMARRRQLRNVTEDDARLRAYSSMCSGIVQQQRSRGFSNMAGPRGSDEGRVLFGDPTSVYASTISNGKDDITFAGLAANEAGYTAEDLAAIFSKKMGKGHRHSLDPETLYLDLENDDPTHPQVQLMQGIRAELEYLEALRKQRTEELILQYRLRQREKGERQKNIYEKIDSAEDSSTSDPNYVPDFTVKEGSPAWYGMEAAKRVKDILRRKQKPDQVVLGADGGSVGLELSRRTAFPKPPPRILSITQTASERLRAAHAALPPLRRAGMSHRHLRTLEEEQYRQHYQASSLYNLNLGAGNDEDGYVYPRDEASFHAYDKVVTAFMRADGVDDALMRELYGSFYQPGMPPHLAERILEYRASLTRAASRLGTGNARIARQLGEPFYLPVAAGGSRLGAGAVRPNTSQSQYSAASSQGRKPYPYMTTWTYGVSPEKTRDLLGKPLARGDAGDTVLILPGSGAQGSGGSGSSHTVSPTDGAGTARRGHSRSGNYFDSASFLSTSLGNGDRSAPSYTSPAAVAAQRLTAMLRVSMQDATVLSGIAGRAYPIYYGSSTSRGLGRMASTSSVLPSASDGMRAGESLSAITAASTPKPRTVVPEMKMLSPHGTVSVGQRQHGRPHILSRNTSSTLESQRPKQRLVTVTPPVTKEEEEGEGGMGTPTMEPSDAVLNATVPPSV